MVIILILITALMGCCTLVLMRRFTTRLPLITFTTVCVVVLTTNLTERFVAPYYQAATFRYSVIWDDPDLEMFHRYFPFEFEAYVAKAQKSILAGQYPDYLLMLQLDFVNQLMLKTMRYASNQTLYDYCKKQLEIDRALFSIDPALVIYFEFAHPYEELPLSSLIISLSGSQVIEDAIQSKEDVILSAIKAPVSPLLSPSQAEETKTQLQYIIASVNQIYGEKALRDLIANRDMKTINARTSAAAFMDYNAKILGLGVNMTGNIFRMIAPVNATTLSNSR